MLFIEAERMAECLYDPEDCESERTVIISELQGGENDPDQLLDQELTATAFKAHPYRHPTIGWLADLQTMTRDDLYGYYRRFYVPNNATLVDRRRRVDRRTCCAVPSGTSGGSRPVAAPPRLRTLEPEQTGERRVTLRKEGTTAYLKFGYHVPGVDDPRFVAAADARRGPDRREGRQPLVQLPHPAATAKRAALSRPGRHRRRRHPCRAPCCRLQSRISTPCR